MARVRKFAIYEKDGLSFYIHNAATPNRKSAKRYYGVCIDSKGVTGGALDISHKYQTGGQINRKVGYPGVCLTNYRCDALDIDTNTGFVAHLYADDAPTAAAAATKLLAQTNPNRAKVDLPIFFAEMREIPKLLYSEVGFWRRLGSTNLKYQFGIKPMVNDLFRMLDFVNDVNLRQKELEHLYRSGIRRKRNLWSGSKALTKSGIMQSSYQYIYANNVDYTVQDRMWGFVEWKPSTYPPDLSKDFLMKQARRAVLGLTVDLNTVWQLMPWSWLIDWFASTGDYIESTRNIIPVTHSKPLIMRETRTQGTWPGISNCSRWDITMVKKTRTPANPTPFSARMPFLTGRQWSILGSIGVTRRSRT